jgi:hypothetical protein
LPATTPSDFQAAKTRSGSPWVAFQILVSMADYRYRGDLQAAINHYLKNGALRRGPVPKN